MLGALRVATARHRLSGERPDRLYASIGVRTEQRIQIADMRVDLLEQSRRILMRRLVDGRPIQIVGRKPGRLVENIGHRQADLLQIGHFACATNAALFPTGPLRAASNAIVNASKVVSCAAASISPSTASSGEL